MLFKNSSTIVRSIISLLLLRKGYVAYGDEQNKETVWPPFEEKNETKPLLRVIFNEWMGFKGLIDLCSTDFETLKSQFVRRVDGTTLEKV